MSKYFIGMILIWLSLPVFAGDESCPHHADHQKQLEQRGDQVMGFEHKRTVHHFVLNPDGGIIRAEAVNPKDAESIENIRKHFVEIAALFSKGDFHKPELVHDRMPSGVPVMQRLKNEITFSIHEITKGSEVRIHTKNQEALKAIHDFLRFQIEDHKTGDPLTLYTQ
jgi:aminoglycoside/choline kinase family phosphotransferase